MRRTSVQIHAPVVYPTSVMKGRTPVTHDVAIDANPGKVQSPITRSHHFLTKVPTFGHGHGSGRHSPALGFDAGETTI